MYFEKSIYIPKPTATDSRQTFTTTTVELRHLSITCKPSTEKSHALFQKPFSLYNILLYLPCDVCKIFFYNWEDIWFYMRSSLHGTSTKDFRFGISSLYNDSVLSSQTCNCKPEWGQAHDLHLLHKKWRFPLRISLVNVSLFICTKEILMGKRHFLCNEQRLFMNRLL